MKKMRMKSKFKSGAASFYVVAFSTLILVIIAASFATAIIAEITRTSNDDLSQSAYDAALAGVEDAKLAFMNYQNCLKNGVIDADSLSGSADITCQDIVYWMNHPDCDMVAHILGRIPKAGDGGEVLIEETTSSDGGSSNEMNQAYTCAMIQTNLDDYRANLSASTSYRVVKVDLKSVNASQIESVRVSWYSNREGSVLNYTNLIQTTSLLTTSSRVAFQPLAVTKAATPPTISVQLVQTAQNFSLAQLNGMTESGATDRATVYLVPTNVDTVAGQSTATYIGAYDGAENTLTAAQVASTNDHSKDLPFAVYCPDNSSNEYACSATLNLPSPIGGARSNDTFMFVVSLPYGQPDTDFSLEFLCAEGVTCATSDVGVEVTEENQNIARLSGVQVLIDSTGRANDLYRRVEVRLESADNAFSYPFYAIQLLEPNSGGAVSLDKDMIVTREYGL